MSTENRALIVWGGWDGHRPEKVASLLAEDLRAAGMAVHSEPSLDVFADSASLGRYSLIVPCWTMGQLTADQAKGLLGAVRGGVGLAGVHGGMGDAFRGQTEYEWMVGGHFVGHPHVGDYTVTLTPESHPITAGLPDAFAYKSEQYYLLVDPGVNVLADTLYTHEGRRCRMPVVWTKMWGEGRVFYSALGHDPAEFTTYPVMREIVRRGLRWAARLG